MKYQCRDKKKDRPHQDKELMNFLEMMKATQILQLKPVHLMSIHQELKDL